MEFERFDLDKTFEVNWDNQNANLTKIKKSFDDIDTDFKDVYSKKDVNDKFTLEKTQNDIDYAPKSHKHEIKDIKQLEEVISRLETSIDPGIELENLIVNGDFTNGTNGWTFRTPNNFSVVNNTMIIDESLFSNFNHMYQKINYDVGDMFYINLKTKINGARPSSLGLSYPTNPNANYPNNVIARLSEVTGNYSTLFTIDVIDCFIGLFTQGNENNEESFVEINDFFLLNLTQTFGAGNEPSKEYMDYLMQIVGWFDGKTKFTQLQLSILIDKLTNRNMQTLIALGGSI